MPAIEIFRGLDTRPFASDDMHIPCLILSLYRAVQFVCLVPVVIYLYLRNVRGEDILVNGVPRWCSQYELYNFTYSNGRVPIFKGEKSWSQETDKFLDQFIANAVAYFMIDVAWITMVWMSASIGTPTEPLRRDVYIRNLLKFKMLFSNIYPSVLVAMGVYRVYNVRNNNYGCGNDGTPVYRPDEGPWYGLFCTLLITYALEILVWPAIMTNKIVDLLRINRFWNRNRVQGRGGKAERFERNLSLILKMISCITRGKAGGKDLKNKGELTDFSSHVMCLLNNQTQMNLVMTDIYVGMRMLSRVQAERKQEAIENVATKNQTLLKQSRDRDEGETAEAKGQIGRRPSMMILQMNYSEYEMCERDLLIQSNVKDRAVMSEGAHFVKYAALIYVQLPSCVLGEFVEGVEEECSGFTRDLDTLFHHRFVLTSIELPKTMLCYANFVNGIVATPYAILVDEEVKKIVIVVRGTRSIEDLVIDVQFVPESLVNVGKICGFEGEDHYCHKGFLARSKWMYNDIKKNRILRTLYSEQSPFKDYPLVLCGHSLGAGCASILSLMLRSSFPSLKCFAYEPPGCIFDERMSEKCEEFLTSFVRHDDLVPRLSYHNFETLRDEFFNCFSRIKIPKIDLFFHLRNPYSAGLVANRNAQVLKSEDHIDRETKFNEQLEIFRAERSEKNRKGINRTQLFIPGKIVHLVDADGKGSYISYWAQRGEFNQLEISKRMYADHDIHSLVGILKDIRLGGENTASIAVHDTLQKNDLEDVGERDVRLFAPCCLNPYGKWPILLLLLGIITSSISGAAGDDCEFVGVSFTPGGFNGTIMVNFGLYAYGLHDCGNATGCARLENHTSICVPYPPNWDIGVWMKASRSFHGLSMMIGSVGTFVVLISNCFILKERTWKYITVLFLFATFFQGLVFIVENELGFCLEPDVDCDIGTSAVKNIAATCLWFFLSVGSGYVAKTGKSETWSEH